MRDKREHIAARRLALHWRRVACGAVRQVNTDQQLVAEDKAGSMSTHSPLYHQPAQRDVRWTFGDLVLIGLVTVGLGTVLLLLLQLPGLLGAAGLREALRSRPLVTSMTVGGLVYGLAVLATYAVIVRRSRGNWRQIGFRVPPLLPMLLTPVLFIGQMIALIVINAVLLALVGEFENPQVAALTDPAGFSWLNFGFVFVVGAIVAPIVEELLFRGLLYQWLRRHGGVAVAAIASAALFSVVHFIPLLMPALFAVGIIFALAFEWSQSLWVTITLHFMQNALGITGIFLVQAFPELLRQQP